MSRAAPGEAMAGAEALWRWLGPLLIALTACVAYHNTFHAPLVFDDRGSILENPTIRSLWPPGPVLAPPIHGLPVTGRPLTNLSFAVNYAVHGTAVPGYHAVNLAIHIACALVLFGIVRRVLAADASRPEARYANGIAAAAALLWVAHPLATAGVTYVSQRAESLGSLFVLSALYAFLRSLPSTRPGRWLAASIAACWLGVGAKEFSAAIPVVIVAYDRVFVAGSWGELLRRRGVHHALLAASWVPLAWSILSTENRGGTWAADSGFEVWEYTLMQCRALVHYLRLVLWPSPLVFDYGRNLPVPAWSDVLPQALLILALVGVIVYGLVRRSRAAFAGLVALGVLAPTSSFVPIADAMFEHRMYLPSAALLVAIAGLVYRLLGHRAWLAIAPVVAVLTWASITRNADYATAIGLWTDTVEKVPENARARSNLGAELSRAYRHAEAVPHLELAWRLKPGVPEVANDLAVALDFAGRRADAIAMYREALRLVPDSVLTRLNLANALGQTGQAAEALEQYRRAVAEAPALAPAHTGLARQFARSGRVEEALLHFREAVRLSPDDPEAHFNLGSTLVQAGRVAESIGAFQKAVELKPDYAAAQSNLGNALLLGQRTAEAITAFRAALRVGPDARTSTNLGYAYLLQGRVAEARAEFESALRLDPAYRPAREGLARCGPR